MKIEYFREFVTLSKYLNFCAAAEYLHITQPVLSRHIASLEDELGAKLLNRTTQSVSLTESGIIFLEKITELLSDYDDLRSLLRLRELGYENYLRIGTPYYAMEEYLGQIPSMFEQKYPETKLQYEVRDPFEMLEMLIADEVDSIIVPRMSFPQINQLEYYKLFKEPMGVLIGTRDPLASAGHCSLSDLKDKLFLSVNNDYFQSFWEHIKNLCRKEGFNPRDPAFFSVVEAAMIAVRRGDGVLVIGQHMRKQQSGEIAYLALDNPECCRDVCVWCKKGNSKNSVRKFIELCRQSVSSEPGM